MFIMQSWRGGRRVAEKEHIARPARADEPHPGSRRRARSHPAPLIVQSWRGGRCVAEKELIARPAGSHPAHRPPET
jgi:hypothetical protein